MKLFSLTRFVLNEFICQVAPIKVDSNSNLFCFCLLQVAVFGFKIMLIHVKYDYIHYFSILK